ncbi:MAG: hypothetical protein ABW321_25890 [Polyangiales bacterium]
MAELESLTRLTAIVEALAAVGGKERGEPLRADDWNVLVSSLVELAKLTQSRERALQDLLQAQFATVDHQHLGQVSLDWFDESTRALIEKPGLNATQAASVARIERDLKTLGQRVDTTIERLDKLERELDNTRDRDLGRTKQFDRIDLRVENLLGLEQRVTGLRGEFAGLDSQLKEALVFRDRLRDPTGAEIDVLGLVQRVSELDKLRDNLRLADGTLGRLRDVERQLVELGDKGVSGDALNEAVRAQLHVASTYDDVVRTRLGEALTPTLDTRFASVTTSLGEVRGEIGALRQDSVRTRDLEALGTRLGATERELGRVGQLSTGVESLGTRLTSVESDVRVQRQELTGLAALGGRLDGVDQRVLGLEQTSAEVGTLRSAVTGLSRELERDRTQYALDFGDLRERIGKLDPLDGRVGLLTEQLTAATTRLDGFDGRVGRQEAQLGELGPRVTAFERTSQGLPELRARMETALSQGLPLAAADAARVSNLTQRVDTLGRWQNTVETRFSDVNDKLARVDVLQPRLTQLESQQQAFAAFQTRADAQLTGLGRVPAQLGALEQRVGSAERLGVELGELRKTIEPTLSALRDLPAHVLQLEDLRKPGIERPLRPRGGV